MITNSKDFNKNLIFIILGKSLIVFAITLLSFYELIFFGLQNGFLNLVVNILIPLILLKIINKKNLKFSLIYFIGNGFIISFLSSFLRVFLFNKFATSFIYYILNQESSKQIIDTMTMSERFYEVIKFSVVGTLFFIVIGIIIKLIKQK
ncbi:membrane hypothetical protein [Tenacibaculum sp. 190524A05c]|uniref:Uncharacterized protein n=1 Tax=Tenacibaculum platacis TaxID=3137852 RepID=A0ABP1ESM2_9FLAO